MKTNDNNAQAKTQNKPIAKQKKEQDLLRVELYIDNTMIDYVRQQRFKYLECKGEAWDLRGKRRKVSVLIVLDYDKKSAKESNIKLNECHYPPPMLCDWWLRFMQETMPIMPLELFIYATRLWDKIKKKKGGKGNKVNFDEM